MMTDLCSSSCFEHIRHPLILIQHKLPEALDYQLPCPNDNRTVSALYKKDTKSHVRDNRTVSVLHEKDTELLCQPLLPRQHPSSTPQKTPKPPSFSIHLPSLAETTLQTQRWQKENILTYKRK